jgi:hypothetical protein
MHRLLVLFFLAAAACGGRVDTGAEVSLGEASTRAVTLRTVIGKKFVTAENGGGGAVDATRDVASTWETFTLYDLDGGTLESGDLVAFGTADGHLLCAESGGGAQVDATRTIARDWETFRVLRIDGSGAVADGDEIALQTKTSGSWVSALDGGGGAVVADRTTVAAWETFSLGFADGGGNACTAAQAARCNCPSGFGCCPVDGSCFQNASDVIYTQCKDVPAETCTMGGSGSPPPPPPPPPPPAPTPAPSTRLRIVSNCAQPIWIAHSDNQSDPQNIALARGQSHDYQIPAGGLAAVRFWPKIGCDLGGHNCAIGDNGQGGGVPCPSSGCQPPLDSKFEATFAPVGSTAQTWYNLSQVDGYTLPFKVEPTGAGAGSGSCVASDCSRLSLDACPGADNLSAGGRFPQYAAEDLRVRDASGKVIACAAPCKKMNYPAPYGVGMSESVDPALHLCCPTPIDPASGQCTPDKGCMTAQACSDPSDPASVTRTGYVAAMHAMCPTAYAYAYDDTAGLHACPSSTGFVVTFCP